MVKAVPGALADGVITAGNASQVRSRTPLPHSNFNPELTIRTMALPKMSDGAAMLLIVNDAGLKKLVGASRTIPGAMAAVLHALLAYGYNLYEFSTLF